LSELVLEQEGQGPSTNLELGQAFLSDSEARLLLQLLEAFAVEKRNLESAYLIEELLGGGVYNDRELRNIYLNWRVGRLGILHTESSDRAYWYRASASPMEFEYFLKMEEILLKAAGLHPRVRTLAMNLVARQKDVIRQLRSGDLAVGAGTVLKPIKGLISKLKHQSVPHFGHDPISLNKISSVILIVSDLSCLYTTRDWGVAGFMSTICAATPNIILDEKR
jgi:hypothetical protein